MSTQKYPSFVHEPGLLPMPEPTKPLPGPGLPPQPAPGPPGEPPLPRPGEPIPLKEPGLADPWYVNPEPAEPPPGVSTPLVLEPLPGPTEASDDIPAPVEPGGEALVPGF